MQGNENYSLAELGWEPSPEVDRDDEARTSFEEWELDLGGAASEWELACKLKYDELAQLSEQELSKRYF